MKNSGIEWIGEIPDDWNLIKVGSIFQCRNEKVNDTDYPPLSVSKGGVVPQMDSVAKSDANDNRKLVLQNDFVINSRSDRKQSCGYSTLKGSVSLINTVLYTTNNKIQLPQYTDYLMKNYGFAEEFYRWGHGIVADLWTTRWQEMKSIVLPIPSIDIQQKIADYLDKKCAAVDRLIENQRAQIEKLKEYKQSVITEAVTRGLDPSAPMKDSGVEWLGKIPMNWNVMATKNLFRIISGSTPKSDNIDFWDGDIIWITPSDFSTEDVFVYHGKRNISLQGLKSCSTALVPKNSIIFSKRAPIGLVVINGNELCTNQGCLSCVNITNQNIKFFYYTMSICTEQYEILGSGTTFKEISAKDFANFKLPCPTKDEQRQIADYLDKKCAEIDKLIAIKQQKIETLTEYKKSLIYEYVTGKKEVVS